MRLCSLASPPGGGLSQHHRAPRAKALGFVLLLLLVFLPCTTHGKALRDEGSHRMSLGQAVVLGVIEGLTEYLPVSSTGHLFLTSRLMGMGGDSAKELSAIKSYVIVVQLGAIVAVIWLYPSRIRSMILGLAGRDKTGRRLAANTIAAFLPAALIGLVLEDQIKSHLFGELPIILALFAGGIAILAVARRLRRRGGHGKGLLELDHASALFIGLAQCIALWPGVSRSLVTIVGAVIVGLSVPAAVEFSFILGLVTLGAATTYEIAREGPSMFVQFGWIAPAAGILAAFVSAAAAMRWMVAYLNRHGLEVFGYYRIALALVCLVLLYTGAI